MARPEHRTLETQNADCRTEEIRVAWNSALSSDQEEYEIMKKAVCDYDTTNLGDYIQTIAIENALVHPKIIWGLRYLNSEPDGARRKKFPWMVLCQNFGSLSNKNWWLGCAYNSEDAVSMLTWSCSVRLFICTQIQEIFTKR